MKIARIHAVTVTSLGHLEIQILKILIHEKEEIFLGYHRTSIPVDGDAEKQMDAVNEHLSQMGFAPISVDEIKEVKKHFSISSTPSKIKAYKAHKDAVKK